MINIVQTDRVPAQPWRNRGGETRELLAWPAPGDWQLRISVADILRDGPFSAYPGVDRWFAVLEGDGVVLSFGTRRESLSPDCAPLQFDGAQTPSCELLGPATRDLNLMVRQDAGRGHMGAASLGNEWVSAAALRAVFVAQPARLQIDDADAATLPAMSLAWSDHATRQRWRLADEGVPTRAWWIDLRPLAT